MKTTQIVPESEHFILTPENNQQLANLCGQLSEHIRVIETYLGVTIRHRGHSFQVVGDERAIAAATIVLKQLYKDAGEKLELTPQHVHMSLQGSDDDPKEEVDTKVVKIKTRYATVAGKNLSQSRYLCNIKNHDINFGIGPAGTGKTFLAVACAIDALLKEEVRRIVLVRPAVEAGESLGFLPGDFAQKVEPYLKPLYDALHDLMGPEWVQKQEEKNAIEIAPLAYMRGRTLNDAFIIMDEAQNTTYAQMKMFLTRLGFGSTAVVTGDITQIDLPRGKASGLMQAMKILKNVEGISFSNFSAKDAVRHRLVQRIINAYECFEDNE